MKEHLNLSFNNSNKLNCLIDEKLPGWPKFQRREVVVQGEAMEFYSRDVEDCLRALWGDPAFADQLVFQPERQYAEKDKLTRIYHEMHTGKWWWRIQVSCLLSIYRELCSCVIIQKKVEDYTGRDKCTLIPLILSSDKTQLTTFRNKSAYPVYLTIGNLPKHIRRKPSRQGQVLLGYLPMSKLGHITNKTSHCRAMGNLFHGCMCPMLKPLEKAGREGIVMVSGDGKVRRCFPIFATYIGDYPEQVRHTA